MKILRVLLYGFLLSLSQTAFAGQEEASTALTEILFDSDMENVSYTVDGSGSIDITFGVSVQDDEYVSILGKLNAHPHINSVLASRGHVNFCGRP